MVINAVPREKSAFTRSPLAIGNSGQRPAGRNQAKGGSDCHGSTKTAGTIQLDALANKTLFAANPTVWCRVA